MTGFLPTFAPFFAPMVKNRSRGVSKIVESEKHPGNRLEYGWSVHISIFRSIGEELLISARKLKWWGTQVPPPTFAAQYLRALSAPKYEQKRQILQKIIHCKMEITITFLFFNIFS